jgi:prevent-host-death family protein
LARWQLQEAKQQFSRLVNLAQTEGPQVVTRHGREVAVIVGADEYRRLRNNGDDGFKEFLFSGEPHFDDLEIERSTEPPRRVEL